MFSNGNFSATLQPVAACQFNFKHSRCSSYFCRAQFLVFIRLHRFCHCISSAGKMSKTANICPLPLTETTGNPTKVFWSAIITTPLKFYLTTVLYSPGLFLKEMAHPSSAEPSCKSVQSSLPSPATKMPHSPQPWGWAAAPPRTPPIALTKPHQSKGPAAAQRGHHGNSVLPHRSSPTLPTHQFKPARHTSASAESRRREKPCPSPGVVVLALEAVDTSVSLLLAAIKKHTHTPTSLKQSVICYHSISS